MSINIDALERAALAATPGQWDVVDGHYPGFRVVRGPSFNISLVVGASDLSFEESTRRERDAEWIAAASPAAELALLQRLRAAEKALSLAGEILKADRECLAAAHTCPHDGSIDEEATEALAAYDAALLAIAEATPY